MSKKIIDFEIRGCAIKLYIGECDDWGGDDWDDAPYEHNAGTVYDRYVTEEIVLHLKYDGCYIYEPSDCSGLNSRYSKDDMKAHRVPMFVVLPETEHDSCYWYTYEDFYSAACNENSILVYMGDDLKSVVESLEDYIVAFERKEVGDDR